MMNPEYSCLSFVCIPFRYAQELTTALANTSRDKVRLAAIRGKGILREEVFNIAKAAGLRPTKEERGIIDEDESRPDDVKVPTWIRAYTGQRRRF